MQITFRIEYHTDFGEQLHLCFIDCNGKGAGKVKSVDMETSDGKLWKCAVFTDSECLTLSDEGGWQCDFKYRTIDYFYSVWRNGEEVRREWQMQLHRLTLLENEIEKVIVSDRWIDTPKETYFYSSAFTECLARHSDYPVVSNNSSRLVRLKVAAPQLGEDEHLALLGSSSELGLWQPEDAVMMKEQQPNVWIADVEAEAFEGDAEFKFIVLGNSLEWESGNNRRMSLQDLPKAGELAVIDLGSVHYERAKPHFAGTLIPVFSLRSKGSFGIGDFGDLRMMIDWIAKTGQRVLQILPVNDTTLTHSWVDSYPYNGISVFALHPQYVDLRQIPRIADVKEAARMEKLRLNLNALESVDYEKVNDAKTRYLHIVFRQEGRKMMRRVGYRKFFEETKEWLEPYAEFCCRRDKGKYSKTFYCFVQYLLDQQMQDVHNYARSKGVVLKGDIPIGVNPEGCDAEQNPELFNLEMQAGAPPDDFAADGQNWGFPTYNWDNMLKDGCRWWQKRLQHMSRFFDAYRIDHVLGFFRIWEIPKPETSGLYGQFAPSLPLSVEEIRRYGCSDISDKLFLEDHRRRGTYHPRIAVQRTDYFIHLDDKEKTVFNRLYDDYYYSRNLELWRSEAMRKLPYLINATRMLACAEDLGMVPDCVPSVMNDLKILSLEVESMPKQMGRQFADAPNYPYLSVAMLSTHDMPTLRMWWDEDYNRAKSYYNNVLHHDGEPQHPLSADVAREIIMRQLCSPSMLTILSLQDWLATDSSLRKDDAASERINIPANPRHYWRYRMHITIEKLLQAKNLQEFISGALSSCNRK